MPRVIVLAANNPSCSPAPRLEMAHLVCRYRRSPAVRSDIRHRCPSQFRDPPRPQPGLRSLICALHSAGGNCQWQDKRQRRIVEAESAAAFIPKRGAVIFSIDEEGHASNILSYADAALSSAQEQATAKASALHAYVNSEAAQPKDGNVIAAKALFGQGWRSGIFERGRAQSIRIPRFAMAFPPVPRRSTWLRCSRGSGAHSVADTD